MNKTIKKIQDRYGSSVAMARSLGVSRQQIDNYRNGKNKVPISKALKIKKDFPELDILEILNIKTEVKK